MFSLSLPIYIHICMYVYNNYIYTYNNIID